MLLRKKPSPIEVYNDTAGAVVNFFRVLRESPKDLIESLRLTPFAVDEYMAYREQSGSAVERARRFFVRSWGGYTGITGTSRNRGWRRTSERDVAGQFASAADALAETSERLRRVAIDNLDWSEVLNRYDSKETLFYVDPPYWMESRKSNSPSDGYGKHELSKDDHKHLLFKLQTIEGSVVLSGYNNDFYSQELTSWTIHRKQAKTQNGSATEFLWVNQTKLS